MLIHNHFSVLQEKCIKIIKSVTYYCSDWMPVKIVCCTVYCSCPCVHLDFMNQSARSWTALRKVLHQKKETHSTCTTISSISLFYQSKLISFLSLKHINKRALESHSALSLNPKLMSKIKHHKSGNYIVHIFLLLVIAGSTKQMAWDFDLSQQKTTRGL